MAARKRSTSSTSTALAASPKAERATLPGYGYVGRLVDARERAIGGGGARSRISGDSAAGVQPRYQDGTAGVRTLTDIVREIRNRRKLLVTPPIPRAYRKTAQVIRAGQAILADLCLRLPAVLTAKPMTVSADPLDDDDESQAAATLKEEWLTAVLLGQEGRRALLDQGKTSIWRDWMDNLVNVGRASFTLTCRPDRWGSQQHDFPRLTHFEDDGDDVVQVRRRTARQKYLSAAERFKRQVLPFVHEGVDPLAVHIVEDDEGIEDEAVIVTERPYRATLQRYGMEPTEDEGPDTFAGASLGSRYRFRDAQALGRPLVPLELDDDGSGGSSLNRVRPERVQCVTYYCSARRAAYLGLTDPEGEGYDPDAGVWAQYVDGVLVDGGPLLGPSWHPLPVFRAFGLSTAMGDDTYTGIAAPMHLIELIDLLDQIITMELHISFWSAFPPLLEEDKTGGGVGATGLSGDLLANPEQLQQPSRGRSQDVRVIEPGKFYSVPPGRQWRYLVMPPEATAHLERLYAKATGLIDLLGIPSVFRGQGTSGQPGYAIAQLMIAAKSLYDPVIDNSTACVAQAAQYTLWQVWKRFPEGVPIRYGGNRDQGRKRGWRTLRPQDIAPDANGAGKGAPFLALSITADPLLPVDEAQLEERGLRAQAAGAIDMLTMRERFFHDPAPERTEARVVSDKINAHPLVTEVMALRGAVREQVLLPEMALTWLQKQFGISMDLAFEQLAQVGAFTDEQAGQLALQMQMQQQTQMQGGQPIPGVPGLPQAPGLPPQQPSAPTPPGPPVINPGGGMGGPMGRMGPMQGPGAPLNQGGQPVAQPTIATRQAAMMRG